VRLTFEEYVSVVSRGCVYAIQQQLDIRVGVDRKDNEPYYDTVNSVGCCWLHNCFKSDVLSHEQMLDAAHRYQIPCGNHGSERRSITGRAKGINPPSQACRVQRGYVYSSSSSFHCRYYVQMGSERIQRSRRLCSIDVGRPEADRLAAGLMALVNGR
jgi:hypothetical protein